MPRATKWFQTPIPKPPTLILPQIKLFSVCVGNIHFLSHTFYLTILRASSNFLITSYYIIYWNTED